MIDKLKFHEKNPEKHPMYPDEWKKFWNRRYKELQAEGKNPAKHDFKPEWIQYWNKRMREMYDEELKSKKDDWRVRLGLPEEGEEAQRQSVQRKRVIADKGDDVIVLSPPPTDKDEKQSRKDVTVADIKNTWKALTGNDIKESIAVAAGHRSPSPWEENEGPRSLGVDGSPSHKWWQKSRIAVGRGRGRGIGMVSHRSLYDPSDGPGVVNALRVLTALENQLGSLGPQVNTLLAKALSLEKVAVDSSEQLLADPTHSALFETAREKLKGQLFAGIVERPMVNATRSAIESVNSLLAKAEKFGPSPTSIPSATPVKMAAMSAAALAPPLVSPVASAMQALPASEPVVVPGIGAVDKVAIAQQIAEALVAQGRTDVSQEELETLINAVVGMAQASAASHEPISAAAYARQHQHPPLSSQPVQAAQLSGLLTVDTSHVSEQSKTQPLGSDSPFTQLLSSVSRSATGTRTSSTGPSALQILQSAYNESSKSFGSGMSGSHKTGPFSGRAENMDDLSEEDLKTLLMNFKELPCEEQYGLISYLKKVEAKEPTRVERLRQFVNVGQLIKSPKKELPTLRKPPSVKADSTFQNKATDLSSLRGVNKDRLSPFSLREGGINPSGEERISGKVESEKNFKVRMDDSDDDYSFEDIYAAASRKVKEREKAIAEETAKREREEEKKKKKAAEDPRLVLKETKAIIANLMGQLPAKFIQKQSPLKESPKTPRKEVTTASVSEGSTTSYGGTMIKKPMFDLSALQQPAVEESMHMDMNQHSNMDMGMHSVNMDMGNSNMDMNNSQYYSNFSDPSGNYGGQYQNQDQYTNQGYPMQPMQPMQQPMQPMQQPMQPMQQPMQPMQPMQQSYPAQGGYGYHDGGYYSTQQQQPPQQNLPHHHNPLQEQYPQPAMYGGGAGASAGPGPGPGSGPGPGPGGSYHSDQNMVPACYQQSYQPGPQNYPTGFGQYSGQQGYYGQ